MRRVLMLGLLMVPGWAGACSIPNSPQTITAAQNKLAAAIWTDMHPCGRNQPPDCIAYYLPAKQVAQLLSTIYRDSKIEPPKQNGIWFVRESPRYGRVTAIWDIGKFGSITTTRDIETAYEKLESRLYKAQQYRPAWLWQSCWLAGIIGPEYQASNCHWQTTANQKVFSMQIESAEDNSLPSGTYEWADFGTCGFLLIDPKN